MQQLQPSPAPAAAPRSQPGTPAPARATASAPADATSAAPLPFNRFIALAQDAPAAGSDTADTKAPDATAGDATPAPADNADSTQQLPSMADNGMPVLLNFLQPPTPAPVPAANDGAAGTARLATLAATTAPTTAPAPLASLLRTAGSDDLAASAAPGPAPAAALASVPATPAAAGDDDGAAALPAAPASRAQAGAVLPSADSAVETVMRCAPQPGAPLFAGPAPTADSPTAGAAVKLPGNPDQWQQPLRDALGDRLQLQVQRNSEQATIRLDPPNLGRIDISIRHSGGALQVNLSASNNEVLRQLNAIGDNVRQDLSQKQYTEVAVTVSAMPRGAQQGYADGGQGGRQQGREQQQRAPGRALSDDEQSSGAFAMSTDRE
jgi:flagellar hook-length control protein FliK